MLQYHFNWKILSALAGITWWNFYFRLYPGAIRSPQLLQFLQHLLTHIAGNLIIIWDGLRQHRSRMVRDFVSSTGRHIALEFLPAYAPEMNPFEYLWGHWNQHEIPNFCPKTFSELSYHPRRALRRMRRRRTLVTAFWKKAELFEKCHYIIGFPIIQQRLVQSIWSFCHQLAWQLTFCKALELKDRIIRG